MSAEKSSAEIGSSKSPAPVEHDPAHTPTRLKNLTRKFWRSNRPAKRCKSPPSATAAVVSREVIADGRSAWTRRWKDLTSLHLDDLGLEELSAAQVALAKRAATLET